VKKELIMLLAFDALLLELDENFKGVNENDLSLIHAKTLEEYGMKIGDEKEKYENMQKEMIRDIYKMREDIVSKINSERAFR
jgi:hypothetical protein